MFFSQPPTAVRMHMTYPMITSWHVGRSVDTLLPCGGKQVTNTGPKTVAKLGGVRICHTDLHESSISLLLTLAFKKQETVRPTAHTKMSPLGRKQLAEGSYDEDVTVCMCKSGKGNKGNDGRS